jgi:hypothetical protein
MIAFSQYESGYDTGGFVIDLTTLEASTVGIIDPFDGALSLLGSTSSVKDRKNIGANQFFQLFGM